VARTARPIARLARARNRLAAVPTVAQVRTMAWFDGREPWSYLLNPEQNFVPEPLEFGYERSSACCLSGRFAHRELDIECVRHVCPL
jgi:hypothetical protein